MIDDVRIEDMPEDHDHPATKGDLSAVKHDLRQLTQALHRIDRRFDELRDHFDATLENIMEEMKGANQAEIALIAEKHLPDHEARIRGLEKQAGLPVGPLHGA